MEVNIFCNKCGNLVKNNEKFCRNCGNKILVENNQKQKKGMSFIGKYLTLVGICFIIFLIPYIVSFFATIFGNDNFRFGNFLFRIIPVFGISFGWIVILILNEIKKNNV